MRAPRGSRAPESAGGCFFESLHPAGNSAARNTTHGVARANVMASSSRGKHDRDANPAQPRGGGAGGRKEGGRGTGGEWAEAAGRPAPRSGSRAGPARPADRVTAASVAVGPVSAWGRFGRMVVVPESAV